MSNYITSSRLRLAAWHTKCFASLLALCSIAVSDAIGDDFIYEEPPDLSNHGFSPTNFGPFKVGLHTISGGLNSEGTGQGDSGDAFRLQNTQDWIVTSVMVSVEVPPESGPVTVICNPCGNSVVVSESTTFEFLPEPSNTFGNWLFNVVRQQSGGLVNVTYTWTIAVQSCPNGLLDSGEGCDDGNATNGDGCDSTCQVEPGSKCTGEPSICITDIPAVSEWGIVAMTLLTLTAGTLVLRRRRIASTC